MKKLTYKNCHRAVKVRQIDNPDVVFAFEFRGIVENKGMFHTTYAHKLTNEETGEVVSVRDIDSQLNKYEIVEECARPSLEELDELASRAHSWSSFDPERVGRAEIIDFEKSLEEMLSKVTQEHKDDCLCVFRSHVRDILNAESNIASAAVTGPAGFNNHRNEKAHNSYDKAVERFKDWKEKYLKKITKEIEDAKPAEQKAEEEWIALKKDLAESVSDIADVDNGAPYYRSAFVNSIYGKVSTMAQNGKREIVAKAMDFIRECNGKLKKPVFTERHKFWKLLEECDKAIELKEKKANTESREADFNGVRVIKNFAEDRLQLVFDGKPAQDVIRLLKSNGFRWSPRFMAWQRQLTSNAYYGAARVVGVDAKSISAI